MSSFSNPQSFVQRTFPPLIGSLTSLSVEHICQKNNVSFAELLRPFCNVYVDHHLKDPSGNDLMIKHLKVGVQDVKEQPPAPAIARRLLNEAVAGASCDVTREVKTGHAQGSDVVEIPAECPWFQAWRETFLQVQFPSDHEFTRHLLGCMLVTSTQDPPETMAQLLDSLKEMQAPGPARLPKWFCPAIFKFYVVLHDARVGDKTTALQFFESIKTAYGADHCFFLEINSRERGENGVINHWTSCVSRRMASLDPSAPDSPQQANEIDISAPLDYSLHEHPLSPRLDNHKSIPSDVTDGIGGLGIEGNRSRGECGVCLSTKNVESLQELMCSVVRHALLPHVEKQIYILNDLVQNKKGMSRSLLSATKRLFGSPRPGIGGVGGAGGAAGGTPAFAWDAPELQLRRLGDLYFIFSSYSNAFLAYYAAKRELSMDQAWLYYAGALEMAALSSYMLPEPSKKAVEYMEEAIMTYLNSCQLPQFATRATLLSVECLKEREMFSEAAKQLIRMTSEESDLRSALLLEQAAYCVLRDSKPRRYAFQLVLAGHRYTKAGQRRHALRCVRQALQVYGGRGWGMAEDHIHSTIGRLAGQLHQQGGVGADVQLLGEGLRALGQLLHSRSRQGSTQQATYLLEYLNMHQAWQRVGGQTALAPLPLPTVEDNSPCVRVVAGDSNCLRRDTFQGDPTDEAARWARMEELALAETVGAPMVFRPSLPVLSKASLNSQGLIMATNERLEVQFSLHNPLQISLPLARLRLLWTWTGTDGKVLEGGDGQTTPNEEAVAFTEELPALLLPPQASRIVTLSVIPRCGGRLQVNAVACTLTTAVEALGTGMDQVAPMVRGRQDLVVRGRKLRPPKDRPVGDYYADDQRLHATVVSKAPLLTLSGVPTSMDMLCGQMEEVQLELVNSGNLPLTSLHAVNDAAGLLALPPELTLAVKTIDDAEYKFQYQVVPVNLGSVGGSIGAGVRFPVSLWVRAPDTRGSVQLHLLLLYTGGDAIRHRILRVTLRLVVADGLQMSAVVARSPQGGDDAANLCVTATNQHAAPAKLNSLVLASRHWNLVGPAICPADMTIEHLESSCFVSRARGSASGGEVAVSSVGLSGPVHALGVAASSLLLRRAACQLMVLGLVWETSVEGRATRGLSVVGVAVMGTTAISAPSSLTFDIVDAAHAPRTVTIFGPDRVETALVGAGMMDVAYVSLLHPDKVAHSFNEKRVCLVDVTVTITSASAQELIIEINPLGLGGPLKPSRSNVYTPHAAGAFAWAGRSRAKLSVPPRGRNSITLSAAMTKPGTYDLAVRLTAAIRDGKGLRSLPPPPESPLIVTDADAYVSNTS